MHHEVKSPSLSKLTGIVLLIVVATIGAALLSIWSQRVDTIADAKRDNLNLATIFAEQTSQAVHVVDASLSEMAERVAGIHEGAGEVYATELRSEQLYRWLVNIATHMPDGSVVTIVDANGHIANQSLEWPAKDVDLSDRDYVSAHVSGSIGLFVGTPVIGRTSGKAVVLFSRRIEARQGTFLGVAAIAIPIIGFQHIYGSIQSLTDQIFSLVRKDGTFLVRYPDSTDRAGAKLPPDSPFHGLMARGGGLYHSPGIFDGSARLAAVRTVGDYPLSVIVLSSEAAALAPWRKRAIVIAAVAGLFLLGLTIMLRLLINEARKTSLQAEQLRQKDAASAAKSDFLATMSHEIRSPMNGMMGTIDLLRVLPLGDEPKHLIDLLHESASALLGILNDILDFSKIEAGAVTLAPESVSIAHLVNSVRDTMMPIAARKGLAFEAETAADVPNWVSGDPMRLRQILVNLVGNAIKFTAKGSVGISVAAGVDATGAPVLTFAVKDTGIGITAEAAARLFRPFTQAEATTTRNFGGTGLGLSISRRLATLMGGTLEVTSVPGLGSVFTLSVPLLAAEAPAAIPLQPDGDKEARLASLHVLVAEDLPTNRFVIERQLRCLGVGVETAENGEQALAALGRGRFDVLITDFHMPIMDGPALTRRIREDEAKTGRTRLPIVGLTADVTEKGREYCLSAGMDDVVSKPTDMRRLREVLRSLLPLQADDHADRPVQRGVSASPIFDPKPYREMFEPDDPEGPIWLTKTLAAAMVLFGEMRRAAENAEPAAMATTAHKLAGLALCAGATRLGETCRKIEMEMLAAAAPDLIAMIGTVEAALDDLGVEADKFNATLPCRRNGGIFSQTPQIVAVA